MTLDEVEIATTAELLEAGITRRQVLRALDAGTLANPFYGIYTTPEIADDSRLADALACRRGGVIGYLSAAVRHGLCDAMPDRIDVFVPAETSRPGQVLPLQYWRTRNPAVLTVGVEVEDFHGYPVRITNPARTVVDLYRIRPEAVRQHSAAALARYFAADRRQADLHRIAKKFNIWGVIGPEAEIAQETLRTGYMP